MLLTFDSVRNRQIKRFLEHCIYLLIVLVLIPGFTYFEICIVMPALVEQWSFSFYRHIAFAFIFLLNIIGNLIYGMFTNTSIKGRYLVSYKDENWTLCEVCECMRPPRAWHCNICNVCILKRDHHCTFFACCVGYYNQRYFMHFTLYIFVAMAYTFYYNIQFLSLFITWNHGLSLLKFVFPLASMVIDSGDESLYVFCVVINFIVGLFTGFLFIYHFNNILDGKIVHERNNSSKSIYNKGWKQNLIEVFGVRWYLTWISPFVLSELPGNGIEWDSEHKQK